MGDTFNEEESEEIVTIGEEIADQFDRMVEDETVSFAVMLEAGLLAGATFACTSEMSDEQIVETFKESLTLARKIVAENEVDDLVGESFAPDEVKP